MCDFRCFVIVGSERGNMASQLIGEQGECLAVLFGTVSAHLCVTVATIFSLFNLAYFSETAHVFRTSQVQTNLGDEFGLRPDFETTASLARRKLWPPEERTGVQKAVKLARVGLFSSHS